MVKRIAPQTPAEHLWKIAEDLDVEIPRDRGYGHGKLVEELWEHTVGDKLWAPTFVRDFPVETIPLTREHRSIEGVTEKWDLYVPTVEQPFQLVQVRIFSFPSYDLRSRLGHARETVTAPGEPVRRRHRACLAGGFQVSHKVDPRAAAQSLAQLTPRSAVDSAAGRNSRMSP